LAAVKAFFLPMARALQQQGHAIGRYRARSLMREAQLAVARRRTHRYRKAEGEALVAPDLLERQFESGAINRVWAGDITYGTPSQRSPPAWG
jgi:putative transposase